MLCHDLGVLARVISEACKILLLLLCTGTYYHYVVWRLLHNSNILLYYIMDVQNASQVRLPGNSYYGQSTLGLLLQQYVETGCSASRPDRVRRNGTPAVKGSQH